MNKNKLKGFTLIEIIVVIAILGVLAAILVPSMLGYTRQAKVAATTSNAKIVYSASKMAMLDAINKGTVTVEGGEIYLGDDSGVAHAVGGSDDLYIGNYTGDEFYGHYGFRISENGIDVECAVWSNRNAISADEVTVYTQDEMEQNITGHDIGSFPNKK